ncbi:hypothetical protein V8E53_005906 [Lactarius tabidus]
MDNSSENLSHEEPHEEREDFGDGANALWSLFFRQAKTQDEAQFHSLMGDMDGVLLFAGLFSAVLTSFLVQSIQELQPNPAQQSLYYQQQSLAMLVQISQQMASIAPQVSIPSTPPSPYLAPSPSSSDILVNCCWLISLICSLSAALLAILIQQWSRSYLKVFQLYDHPLKRARFRQFFFEGAKGMPALAELVPALIHLSLFLFFVGLSDSMLNVHVVVGVSTIVPICLCGSFYLYSVLAPVWNPQSPYRNPYSPLVWYLIHSIRKFCTHRRHRSRYTPRSIEANLEELVMAKTKERKGRDARAIRWLVDNTTANVEMEPFVLAIPGSFDTEWGLDVWLEVSSSSGPGMGRSHAGSQVSLLPNSPHLPKGTSVHTISRCVRYLFETCNNHNSFTNKGARHRRMRACIEVTVPLICRSGFQLDWFGEISELVSEIGHIEQINQSPTSGSDLLFVRSWTCLSLMVTPQILNNNQVRMLARLAVGGLGRYQSTFGKPDEAAQKNAQTIDSYLEKAWDNLDDLRRAFEPSGRERTREQVEEIIRTHETQVSELVRIGIEADSLEEEVDWRVFLLQDAMDDAGHRLMRQLPGVSFSEFKRTDPSIREVFNFPFVGTTPFAPRLIFPGQQLQALAKISLKLREILNGGNSESDNAMLESLKILDQIPTPLHRPDSLMTRQLWRLQDLRDGGGLGFTLELFFLTFRQLLSTSVARNSDQVSFCGTFKAITSRWADSTQSLATQNIVLSLACDLIIPRRGVFSDFDYPVYITDMLFNLIGDMLRGSTGSHIDDVRRELEEDSSNKRMDMRLRDKALIAIPQSRPRNMAFL